MPQKASTPAPAKPRQRPRSGLLAVAADLKAGKSIGRIGLSYEEAAEEGARRRAFFRDEFGVGSEEYGKLPDREKAALEERWAEKHPKTVAPVEQPQSKRRGRPSNKERRKIIREAAKLPTTAAYVDYISNKSLPPPDSWQEKGKSKLTYSQMYEHPNGLKQRAFRKRILDERVNYTRKK